MLDAHPNLAVGPECPWIGGSYGKLTSFKDLYRSLVSDQRGPGKNFSGITDDHIALALGNAISAILSSYAHAKGKKRWIEKTPNHITDIPFIVKLFPQAKFIHIVRDGRDVACSSFKERATWGPDLVNGNEKISNTRLNALQRWCCWILEFEKWKKQHVLDVIEIKYENLVSAPETVLKQVLDFIGEPWTDEVLRYSQCQHDMPSWEAGSRDVNNNPHVTVNKTGRWKNEFSKIEYSIASSLADHVLKAHGYDATNIEDNLPEKKTPSVDQPQKICLIRTLYPHLSEYSGPHHFTQFLNRQRFHMHVKTVPMGRDKFEIVDENLRESFSKLIKRNKVNVYDLNDLSAEFSVYRQWLNGEIDVIHYLDGEHSLQFLPLIFRNNGHHKKNPPIIATFHQPPSYLDSLINIEIVRHIDGVHVLSGEQASFFRKYLPAEKVFHIPHGVDVEFFNPGSNNSSNGKFRCITVGSWMRDYDTVFDVANRLQNIPDIEFHIVSPQISDESGCENVIWHSGLSDEELLKLYQDSDLLFLPLNNATANNSILEALACGLSIISTDISAVREYVSAESAVLISKGHTDGFINALITLYLNPEQRRQMSNSARRRAEQFSWQKIAAKIEAMYLRCIS
jgi:glycosyltransferase involved in cell wall biosynthesis